MGILDPLKKLLFGVKSVSKHQAEEAYDFTKDKSAELLDKSMDFMKDAGDKIGKAGAKVLDKVDDLWDKALHHDTAESIPNNPGTNQNSSSNSPYNAHQASGSSTSDFVDPIKDKMNKITDAAADTFSKAKDTAKEVGNKIVDASDDFWKKAEEFGGNVMDKASKTGTDLFNKAKQAADDQSKKMNQKIDDFIAKEKEIEAKEPKGDFADTMLRDNKNLNSSTLKGHDDFFAKAQQFLDKSEKKANPVSVDIKKVEDGSKPANASTPPNPTPEKPLDAKDQKTINDLLSKDDIEDAQIVDDKPKG